MHKQDTATLNQNAVAERLRELQLKQWWVARQIGVTPLTVNRWLTGKVRRISRDNLTRLAQLLVCSEAELTHADEMDVRATQVEQSQAAKLLVRAETQHLFINTGQYESYERLLKAVMHPNLPIHELVDIYSCLTMAAAERGDFDSALRYSEKYVDYSCRDSDPTRELRARSNHCAVIGASGKLREAVRELETQLSVAESLGLPAGSGMAIINLIHAYWLQAQYAKVVPLVSLSLSYSRSHPSSNVILTVFSNAALLACESGQLELACKLQRRRVNLPAPLPSPEDGLSAALLDLLSRSLRDSAELDAAALATIGEYEALPLHDEATIHWPAVLLRRAGRLPEAGAYLDRMVAAGKLRVYDPPFVFHERARIATAMKQPKQAAKFSEQANQSYTELGMPKRCFSELLEIDSQYKLSRPQVAVLKSLAEYDLEGPAS